MKDGRGIAVWKNGTRYDCFWKNDQANFYGRCIYDDGEYFEGKMKDDMFSG